MQHQVIGIASGNGGAGKSFISCALSCELARREHSVLLVDGDFATPSLDVLLGIAPENDIAAVFAGWIELQDAIIKVGAVDHGPTFDFLPGRSGSGALTDLPKVEAQRLGQKILKLAHSYSYTILDLSSGFGTPEIWFQQNATKVIVVVDPSPTSMTNAYALIKVLRSVNLDQEIFVLINKSESELSGFRTFVAIERATRTFFNFAPKLAGVIVRMPEIRHFTQSQMVLDISLWTDDFSEIIGRVVDAALTEHNPIDPHMNPGAITKFSGIESAYEKFLSRLH